MTEEVANLLRKAMALPPHAREELASSLLNSLQDSGDNTEGKWIERHRKKALAGLSRVGRIGFMEVFFHSDMSPQGTQPDLLKAVEKASIHAFGWPIGVVLHTQDGRPKPMSDGIVAEIQGIDSSYDYWALRRNGDFYFLGSLFEDERTQNAMWFDTRIMRATETFLFCYRLYRALGIPEESRVSIRLRHGGLSGRVLGSARPALWALHRTSHEEEVEWQGTMQLESIRTNLQQLVKTALDPLFVLFDFFQPPDHQVYSEIDQFVGMVNRQQKPFEI